MTTTELKNEDWEAIQFMAPRAINQLKAHIKAHENDPQKSAEKKADGIERSEKLMASIFRLHYLAELNTKPG